jgi:hypothetical protein
LIRYLIDTNLASEMRKSKPHGAALAWLRNLSLGHGYLSAVTFGEIQKGVQMTRIHDPRKANGIESWALQLELTSQVLPMDAACLREYSRLIHGRQDTLREDAMIASTARAHGLTIATRKARDFKMFFCGALQSISPVE